MAFTQNDVNAWLAANPGKSAQDIHIAAKENGIGADMVAAGLNSVGWGGGSNYTTNDVNNYVSNANWGALGTAAPTAAPAGSTTTPAGGGILSSGTKTNTNTNPAIASYMGTPKSGLSMDDAYYKFWQQNAVPQGSKDFNAWLQGATGEPYNPSLAKVTGLGEGYYGQTYTSAADEAQAWNDMIQQSGMSEDEFNKSYGQYMTRAPIRTQQERRQASGPDYPANLNSQVDAPTETIEGRIQKLLDANNPVIRQAGERAMAQFAQRGLLNSSMAIEAANEAMTSKAIEIAGPDAQRYFQNRRENVDWQNKFSQNEQLHGYDLEKIDAQAGASEKLASSNYARTLQTNYLQSIQSAESQMQRFIQSIQASDIPPEAKTAQIQQMQLSFNNTISMMKAAYKNMPQWVDEWSLLPASLEG